MHKLLLAGVAAMSVLAVSGTPALAGGHWKFDLVNSSRAKVISFKTREDGEWSDNWLDTKVAPGETYEMDFGTDEGDCTVKTRIDFSDNTYVSADIDYCNASKIVVRNDGITWQ
jgi:hypothetical protein